MALGLELCNMKERQRHKEEGAILVEQTSAFRIFVFRISHFALRTSLSRQTRATRQRRSSNSSRRSNSIKSRGRDELWTRNKIANLSSNLSCSFTFLRSISSLLTEPNKRPGASGELSSEQRASASLHCIVCSSKAASSSSRKLRQANRPYLCARFAFAHAFR